LVTRIKPGGGSGIGYDIAEGLATNGVKVYVGGRRKEALDKVVHELAQHNLAVIP
jgi:NADP-dependent 3-hydroxy acid dehydrogenase YdfG